MSPDRKPPQEKPAEKKPLRKRLRGWAVEALVFAALLAVVGAWRTRGAVSGPAPELKGLAADGRPVSLADLRGRPVLVHFWGSWCPVCRTEEGTIDSIARGSQVLTVAVQSGDGAAVQAWLRRNNRSFRALPDPDATVASAWGVQAYPTSFVVDSRGSIRFVTSGWTSSLGLRVRLWLAG